MGFSRSFVVMALGMLTLLAATAGAGEGKREEKIRLADAPKAVQETLVKEANGGRITEVERVTVGDKITYEADVVIDGKEYDVTVAPDGTLISKKADEDNDDQEGDDEDEEEDDD